MDYSSQEDKELLEEIIRIARKAGEAILACYSKNNRLSYLKEDGSPVTPADVKAHHIIVHKLKELMPNIYEEHMETVNSEVMNLWEKGFLDIDLFSEDPIITITKKATSREAISTLSKEEKWSLSEVVRLLNRKA